MSAIAGIYRRDGGPIDRDRLSHLSESLEQMGPDGEYQSIAPDDSLGMVWRPFHTHAESRRQEQPYRSHGDVLVWDGWLDNADEVRRELPIPAPAHVPGLVLGAFHQWGLDAFGRMVGDFACALWDDARQRLLLVKDGIGIRPLYYHVTDGRVSWSSRARAILEAFDLPLELDEEFLANFLASPCPGKESAFRAIRSLQGGRALIVDPDRVEVRRYWSFDPNRTIQYQSDHEYEEHFQEVFRKAVASRLDCDEPVYCQLSGGLDSSSIVCVADELIAAGEVSAPSLETVSYVFPNTRASDESEFIRVVERHRDQKGLHVVNGEHPILSLRPEGCKPDLPTNRICFRAREEHLARHMDESGSRVVLNGKAGDQVFCGDFGEAPQYLADYLRRGELRTFVEQTYSWARSLRTPFWKLLWQGGIWPLMPRGVRAATYYNKPMGSWLDDRFVSKVDLRDRLMGPKDDLGCKLPSTRQQYISINKITRVYAVQLCLAHDWREVRYPFLDRRVVEFGLALPMEQLLRPGETRSVLRRGMKGVLPEPIRQRRSKGGPTGAFLEALSREWHWLGPIAKEPRLADFGIVDREGFRQSMRAARHGLCEYPAQLLRTLALELWLRSLENHKKTSSSSKPPSIGRQHSIEDHGGTTHDDARTLRIA